MGGDRNVRPGVPRRGAQRALAFLRANTEGDPALYASVLSLGADKLARLAAAGGEVTPDDEELAAECRARPGRA